jgi:uncharacterized Fe-S cluster-containing radical SAM superfamily protein
MKPALDTNKMSADLRRKTIDIATRRLLITDFRETEQAKDFTKPPNCEGVGRIRHFKRFGSDGWPLNPLPIDPVLHKLAMEPADMLMTQAFQNASCNWRCWYCYVPFSLLSANQKNSRWVSADDLLDLYERDVHKLRVFDLSGGQPDLTPEWVPWMMRALSRRGLSKQTYLWSDDNLSTDYFWRYLTAEDITLIQNYPNYGKVCCFKGISPSSFAFNTQADSSLYGQQFELFAKYCKLHIDLYGYVTFTTIDETTIPQDMADFCDRLQSISVNLPLRVVPLEIRQFTPTKSRMRDGHERALKLQWSAVECWKSELKRRFAPALLSLPIYDILL